MGNPLRGLLASSRTRRVAEAEERTFYRTVNPGYGPVDSVLERYVPLRKYSGDRLVWPVDLGANTVYPARVDLIHAVTGMDTEAVIGNLKSFLGTSSEPERNVLRNKKLYATFRDCKSFPQKNLTFEKGEAKLSAARLIYLAPEDRHPWIGTEFVVLRFPEHTVYYSLEYRGEAPTAEKQRQTLESKALSIVPEGWFTVTGRQSFMEAGD